MADSELFIDVVIIAMYVLIATAVAVSAWSAMRAIRQRKVRQSTRIGYAVAAGVAALLIITYAAASTKAITSNGQLFDNQQWLRLADMFIYSSVILILICSAVVVIARFRR